MEAYAVSDSLADKACGKQCTSDNHVMQIFSFGFVTQGVDVEPEADFDLLTDKTCGASRDIITGVCFKALVTIMQGRYSPLIL